MSCWFSTIIMEKAFFLTNRNSMGEWIAAITRTANRGTGILSSLKSCDTYFFNFFTILKNNAHNLNVFCSCTLWDRSTSTTAPILNISQQKLFIFFVQALPPNSFVPGNGSRFFKNFTVHNVYTASCLCPLWLRNRIRSNPFDSPRPTSSRLLSARVAIFDWNVSDLKECKCVSNMKTKKKCRPLKNSVMLKYEINVRHVSRWTTSYIYIRIDASAYGRTSCHYAGNGHSFADNWMAISLNHVFP